MVNEKEIQENSDLYEIGVHYISTIQAEKATDEFNKLKALIEKHKGEVIKSDDPKTISLSFTMVKKIKGANHKFNQAHFAWVMFNLSKSEVIKIKEALDLNDTVLRYLVIKTANDYEHSTNRLADELKTREEEEKVQDQEVSEKVEDVEEILGDEEKEEKVEKAEAKTLSPKRKKVESSDDIDRVIDEIVK